jgi:hypothetical protein
LTNRQTPAFIILQMMEMKFLYISINIGGVKMIKEHV